MGSDSVPACPAVRMVGRRRRKTFTSTRASEPPAAILRRLAQLGDLTLAQSNRRTPSMSDPSRVDIAGTDDGNACPARGQHLSTFQ